MNEQIPALFTKEELELIQISLASELINEKNRKPRSTKKIRLIKDLVWYIEKRIESREL